MVHFHFVILFTVPLLRVQSIVISLSVCLSACVSQKTSRPNFTKFSVHVTRDQGSIFCCDSGVCCVLLVLWMTSCFAR